jgi:hypothetical protein
MKNNFDFFSKRNLLIVTIHNKNEVLSPLLETNLKVTCKGLKKFNTDSLGTFSGEIERKKSALDTVREKCLQALKIEGYDLAVATEGSFGNHPTLFFAAANEEFILLLDLKNNIEITERVLSLETNFKMAEIRSKEELFEFAKNVHFPSHAVIIKNAKENWNKIEKGIQNFETLEAAFTEFTQHQKSCFIETDMRAHMNPTRMKIIKEAGEKLIQKIKSTCPSCNYPGFGIVRAEAGLKCENCNMPTKSTSAHIYQCKHCDFESQKMFPNGKSTENPQFCDFCNP